MYEKNLTTVFKENIRRITMFDYAKTIRRKRQLL